MYGGLGDLGKTSWTDDQGVTVAAVLRVTERRAGGDLRIREIVWPENPSGGGPLTDGAAVRIEGTLGDGQNDVIPFRIRVDGVDADAEGFVLHVSIGGVEAEPQPSPRASRPAR